MPSIRYFWKKMKIRNIGMIDRVDIANSAPQSDWDEGSENIFMAIDNVYLLGAFKYSRAPKKSSQRHINEKIAVVTIDGTIRGRSTLKNTP